LLKLKILAVDDSPMITEMIRDAFEVEGYRVFTAGDGAAALNLALAENPDLIIADITMPGLDGWELCSQIRSNPFTSFIPFIFLTVRNQAPDRIRGLQMGADDYLTKPFAMEELKARVNLIFQRMLKTQEAVLLRRRNTLSGTTRDMGLSDLIQMFAANQKTGLLKISRVGKPTGRIAFSAGQVIRVELGAARGQKALFRLLDWPDAQFEVDPLTDLDRDESLSEKSEALLLEGARQLDELHHLEQEYPLVGKTIRLLPERAPAESELSPREAAVLGRLQESGNILLILDQLPDPDLDVCKVVVYFIRKGMAVAED
jgi:CheY-like chemotaxis protein